MANATNTLSKDILARLLAGENITVQHDAKARTASFDTRNRVLTLPVWDNMTPEIYDMLVGHEVGHALFTPWTERDEAVQAVASAIDIGGTANADIAMTYLNVVEDARIERLMKEKFPGLRRDFYEAYKSFNERDFFGIKDLDINTLPLIDRINIHFKCGTAANMNIQFTAEEQAFVDRISAAQTFDEVTVIASEIYAHAGHKREDGSMEEVKVLVNATQGMSNESKDGNDAANGDGMKSESDDKKDGNTSASKDGQQKAKAEQKSDQAAHSKGASEAVHTPARSKTQTAFDESCKKNFTGQTNSVTTSVLESPILENIILTPSKIADRIKAHTVPASIVARHHDWLGTTKRELSEFLTESAPTINMMAKQFEMRKAADAAKRTSVSKTGVLDTVRMMNYKMTDDIFLRNSIVADGKSHGLVMYIDWSSSMGGVLRNTVKQLIQLVMFCKKVNIPFDVYAFSSIMFTDSTTKKNLYGRDVPDSKSFWRVNKVGNATSSHFTPFTLINYLSSRLRRNDFNDALLNLWRITDSITNWDHSYFVPTEFLLGSTPLDECIVAAMDMVPKFRDENKLQVVHTVFLTDGESSTGGLPNPGSKAYKTKAYIIDPVTKKMYDNTVDQYSYASTPCLLRIFRDRTKTNAIGFFLMENKTLTTAPWYSTDKNGHLDSLDKNAYEQQSRNWTDAGFAICPPEYNGYTEQYIVRSTTKVSDGDALDNLATGVSATRVANAMIRDAATRNKSRVFLRRFIDLIAKEVK